MFTINIKLINYLISLIPLSLILGNLAININIILICFFGVLIFKKKIFFMEEKKYQYLIYLFFFYLIFITAINNIPNFDVNPFYKKNLLKSLFFLRFLLLFLIINKLIETDNLNIKFFYISGALFSLIISLDIIIQIIFQKNLIGLPITAGRPSSFFGNEHIAGGYIQKFILFFIFLLGLKTKRISLMILLFIIFLLVIIFTGNRMPAIIFLASAFIFLLSEKKFKFIFILFILSTLTLFLVIKYPLVKRIDIHLKVFIQDSIQIMKEIPKSFNYEFDDDEVLNYSSSGYLVHFHSGIQTWKKNKFFGKGIKSFPLNCKNNFNQLCSSHPHNYFIEILLDTGVVGLVIIYSIFILSLLNFLKTYIFKMKRKNRLIIMPFFLIIFFEFFPLRSSGSFFTTNNAVVIFLILAVFVNLNKIKDNFLQNKS